MRYNSLVNAGLIGSIASIISNLNRYGSYYRSTRSTAKLAGSAYRTVKGALGYQKVSNKGVRSTNFSTQRTKAVGRRKYVKGKKGRMVRMKKYKSPASKAQGAFIYSLERGGAITPTVSGVLGHATCPRVQMQRALFGCILRRLFVRAGLRCPIPARPIDGIITGDVVELLFEYGSASLDGWSFSLTTGATLTQAISACVNDFNTKLASLAGALALGNLRIYRAIFKPNSSGSTGSRVELDLTSAKVAVAINSSLRIQNRSVGETGDEDSTEVDNCPVQGRCYQGYGTGPDSRFQVDATTIPELHADSTYGVVSVSNPENMSEAPLTYNFNNVKRAGFTRITPGTIHLSKLNFYKVFSLETMCRAIFVATADGNPAMRIGKYSLFVLEKVIETNNASPLAMNLAYEHQLYMNFKLVNPNTDYPVPEFIRA